MVGSAHFFTYTPSDTRAARALCCDDVNAERAPRVRGVHKGLLGVLGVHVAHFRPMYLTARNSLRHPKSPVMSRTGPTRFDAWSSRGRRPERTLRGHPHVLGRRVVAWSAVYTPSQKRVFRNSENYRWFGSSLYMSIFSHRELF